MIKYWRIGQNRPRKNKSSNFSIFKTSFSKFISVLFSSSLSYLIILLSSLKSVEYFPSRWRHFEHYNLCLVLVQHSLSDQSSYGVGYGRMDLKNNYLLLIQCCVVLLHTLSQCSATNVPVKKFITFGQPQTSWVNMDTMTKY